MQHDALPTADQLILEAAAGMRRLTPGELQRMLEHVARVGFDPRPTERAGGRLAGLTWRGRILAGRDCLPPGEVHYLRHVVLQQEWPPGTDLADYEQNLRDLILDPESGALASSFQGGGWQLAVVRQSGALRGPGGGPWVLVEYRVALGHWVTGFQPAAGLSYLTGDPRRTRLQWLRHPT